MDEQKDDWSDVSDNDGEDSDGFSLSSAGPGYLDSDLEEFEGWISSKDQDEYVVPRRSKRKSGADSTRILHRSCRELIAQLLEVHHNHKQCLQDAISQPGDCDPFMIADLSRSCWKQFVQLLVSFEHIDLRYFIEISLFIKLD